MPYGGAENVFREQAIDLAIYDQEGNELVIPAVQIKAQADQGIVVSDLEEKPAAILPTANNNGYATVRFDQESLNWFVKNTYKIKSFANRALIWNLLEHEVDQARIDPLLFVEMAENNLLHENNGNIVPFMLEKLTNILRYKTSSLEKRMALRGRLNKLYQQKLENLDSDEAKKVFSLVAKEFLLSMNGQQMKENGENWIKEGAIILGDKRLEMTKLTRYILIQKAHACDFYTQEQKDQFFENEKKIDYSVTDDLMYFGCEVMMPEKREKLWNDYIEGKRFNVETYKFSMPGFMTWRNEEVSGEYADKFMACIEQIFREKHRDYAERFFMSLSPAFLNREKDLNALKEILARTNQEQEPHFAKLLKREIQTMEENAAVLKKFA